MSQDDLFSRLPRGSFDGITIPVVTVEMLTGSDAAFHVFPYRAGMDIEYMGRSPITGVITASYFPGVGNDSSNVLWPGTLSILRNRAQEQRSGPLVIPTFGTIAKAMIRIHEKYSPDRRDGSDVTINFWEDSKDAFVRSTILSALGKIEASATRADQARDDLRLPPDETLDGQSFLQSVRTLQNQLSSFQTDIARPFAQAAAIVGAVDDLFRTVDALQDVSNWEAADAFRELKANTKAAIAETQRTRKIKNFVVAANTNVLQIAQSTGNTVADLMGLNALPDPLSVDAGEQLLVYAA